MKRKSVYGHVLGAQIDTHCKHCGSVKILLMKQVFKNGSEHLHRRCFDCRRSNDYASRDLMRGIEFKTVSGSHKSTKPMQFDFTYEG